MAQITLNIADAMIIRNNIDDTIYIDLADGPANYPGYSNRSTIKVQVAYMHGPEWCRQMGLNLREISAHASDKRRAEYERLRAKFGK
jgi:hypothetical protein